MDNKVTNPKLEALESELAKQQAHMNAAMARWLGLLAEYDRGAKRGGETFEGWVAWRFGVCYWEAAELVRVARALAQLPVIRRRSNGASSPIRRCVRSRAWRRRRARNGSCHWRAR